MIAPGILGHFEIILAIEAIELLFESCGSTEKLAQLPLTIRFPP